MSAFEERLNQIIPRITSKELLANEGLGNEIGFYIFDYPPEKELQVRDHIQFVLNYLKKNKPDLRIKHINYIVNTFLLSNSNTREFNGRDFVFGFLNLTRNGSARFRPSLDTR